MRHESPDLMDPLLSVSNCVSLDPMSICARNSYRGYRYYGFPNGTPGLAVRG
jgi:hypothetical protein